MGQQQGPRDLENRLDLRAGDDGLQGLQAGGDMARRGLWQWTGFFPCDVDDGFEQRGDSLAHVGDRRDNRDAKALAQCLDIDIQALAARFVDAVQGNNHRSSEQAEFKAEFKILFQHRRVDHLDKDIWRGKVATGFRGAPWGNGWPAVTPQQVHEHDLILRTEAMQRFDRRQVDQ